jgi:signal transduction histidine kinase
MSLLIARPASNVKAVTYRYAAAIVAVALISLLGSFIGIAKVMEPFSKRLNSVSHNMEKLAEGDYSIRMKPGASNEVERLVGYFNTMAGSLDETNQQLAEKTRRLATALNDLRALDKAKDDFLVLISHEVRTPLTSIMGGIDYLKSSLGRCEDSLREVLAGMNVGEITEIMDHSAARLRDFMNDAIQMISIQNSDRELHLQAVPAGEFLSACLTPLRDRIEQRGLELEVELGGEDGWELLCDVEVLRIALVRILDNAIVHNEDEGRIRLAEAESVPARGAAASLVESEGVLRLLDHVERCGWDRHRIQWRLIEIYNTGPAIPASRQKHLFSKFQVVGEIEHHQKGSGLSLPIALAAVEHHGGQIFLNSHPDEGNSFFLLLPGLPAGSGAAQLTLLDEQRNGLGGAAGDEEIGQVADAAGLEIELDHARAAAPGGGDEAGGGIDGAGRADHEKEVTLSR